MALQVLAFWEQPARIYAKINAMFAELYGEDAAQDPLLSLIMSTEGPPVDAAKATVSINPAGDDNGLTYTAVDYGAAGNAITVRYVNPAANDADLGVVVAGSAITVNLATDGGGAITSTAADVLAAIEGSAPAAALVVPTIYAADAGVADDGSGVVTAIAATNLAGGADGTGAGTILPGGLNIDTTNGVPYRNSGTTAVPAWTALADAA